MVKRRVLGLLGVVLCLIGSVVIADTAEASPNDPEGAFDVISRGPGGIRVQGWALDPDLGTTPIQVHVYVDGVGAAVLTANTHRPDVGAARPGKGDYHGFDSVFPYTAAGSHTVCAYAINGAGPGGNPLLACKAIAIDNAPFGAFDTIVAKPGGLEVAGWAIDSDVAGTVGVHVYVDNVMKGGFAANAARGDIAVAYPQWGSNHGFWSFVGETTPGTKNVCVYAINEGAGNLNTQLGCKSVTIQADPQGGSVSATQEYTGLRVRGWLIDPSTSSAINYQVRRYTTASAFTVIGTGTANASSPAVGSAYSAWGANHGVDITIPGTYSSGTNKICVVGVNVSTGSNREVGCQSGNPPAGNIASIAVTAPTASQELWGTAATLTASVSAGSVDSVEFYLDGSPTPVATDNSSPYSQTWNSTTVADGTHTVMVKAKKSGVLVGESATVTFTVKNTVAIGLTDPANGTATYGTLLLKAAPDAGVTSVEFYLDDSPTPVGSDSSAPFEFEWDSSTVDDGFHTVTAKAKRGSTVVATSAPVTIDVWNCQ